MSDHVYMLISIPPKYAVSSVVGFLKGKSAIHVARNFMGKQRNYQGQFLMGQKLLRGLGGKKHRDDPKLYSESSGGGSPTG